MRSAPVSRCLVCLLLSFASAGDGGAALASGPSGETPAPLAGRPLTDALLELREEGLKLLFTSQVVRPEMVVLREPAGQDPRGRLEELLPPFGLTIREGPGDTLVVVPRPGAGPGSGIHGEVREILRQLPLEGVQVLLQGTEHQVLTDAQGRFTLAAVPPGTYTLVARRPGFVVDQREGFEVPPWGVVDVVVALLRTPLSLDQVVVTPSQISLLRSDPVAALALRRDEIEALPHLGDDLFRAMTLLPGIRGNELSAQFNIRGGRTDEVLVMLDQLELIEPFHLQDFSNAFSIIPPKAISEVDLILGGFPARFGDRMGGVLDMRTSAAPGLSRGHLAVSVLGAQTGGSGRYAEGRGDWLAVARFGFPEVFLSYLNDGERPRYWDAFGKLRQQIAGRHFLGFRILHADDSFDHTAQEDGDTEQADTDYRNSYAWATHQALLGPRLFVDTILSRGRVDRDRRSVETEGEEDGFTLRDQRALEITGLKQDWSFQPSEDSYWRWGADARRLEIEYDYFNFRRLEDPLEEIRHEPRSGTRIFRQDFRDDQLGAYLSDRLRLRDSLTVELGLRYDQHSLTDDGDLSPRVNLVVGLGKASTLRAAWGYFFQSQRPYELQVEDGETAFLPSERTELFALGYEHLLARGATLRLDAYHRQIRDPRPRFGNLFDPVDSFPEIEPDRIRIVPDRSSARGIEIFFRSRGHPRFNWWVNYAYSRTEDRIDGSDVARDIDQPHTLNLNLAFRLPSSWNLNLAFRYSTGWPTTAVSGRLAQAPEEMESEDEEDEEDDEDEGEDGLEPGLVPVPVFGPLYGERLRDYHRLDLRASRQWKLRKGRLSLFIDLQNLYDRENVAGLDTEFEFDVGEDGSVRLLPVPERWGGFLPSIGIEWEF